MEAAKLLSELARAEVELENLLGVHRPRNYPPERPLLPGDVRAQAGQDAMELRQRLGLGFGPIADIVSLLEFEIGMRVYVRRLDSKISGLFAYDDALGACMLLNANHPRGRRNQSAEHETGHFISDRRERDASPSEANRLGCQCLGSIPRRVDGTRRAARSSAHESTRRWVSSAGSPPRSLHRDHGAKRRECGFAVGAGPPLVHDRVVVGLGVAVRVAAVPQGQLHALIE